MLQRPRVHAVRCREGTPLRARNNGGAAAMSERRGTGGGAATALGGGQRPARRVLNGSGVVEWREARLSS